MEVRAADLNDFGPSRLLGVRIGDVDVLLVLEEDGSIRALEDRCSHADFKLSGGRCMKGSVECPAHGARFDTGTGAALCMPAFSPVRTFPCRVEGDAILVDL